MYYKYLFSLNYKDKDQIKEKTRDSSRNQYTLIKSIFDINITSN